MRMLDGFLLEPNYSIVVDSPEWSGIASEQTAQLVGIRTRFGIKERY